MLSGIARLNANMKVASRILVGFAIILLLLVALGAMAVTSLVGVKDEFGEYSRISRNALLVQEIQTDFHVMRRNALTYVATGSSIARDQAIAAEQQMEKLFGELRLVVDSDRQRADQAKAMAREYVQNFQRVVALGQAAAKLRTERTDGVGQRITEALDSALRTAIAREQPTLAEALARVLAGVTQLRLDSVRVQLRPDAELLRRIEAAARAIDAAFPTALAAAGAGTDQALLQKMQADAQSYAAALGELGRTSIERERLAGEVSSGIARRLDETLEALSTRQHEANRQIRAEVSGDIDNTLRASVITTAVAVLLGGLLAWLIGRGIAGPVRRMTAAMTDLAGGKLDVDIPARDNRDEIGAMAKAVQVFKDNAIAVKQLEEEQKAAAIRAEAEKKAAMVKLADDFQGAVGGVVQGVSSAATEMQGSAQALSATAEETSRQATAVGAATEQASANVQTVAASAEELSASISEISRQVATSAQIAQKAVEQANATNGRIESLSAAASQIGDVVRLIGEIAGKTNLLALNATIEAARAGEAGKGFAVVAAEVKTLATQTARATEEIGAKVSEMQGATAHSVEAIKSIGQVIGEISTIATSIASAVEQQGAATAEIARNVQEAAKGTQEVSANISGVTQASGETGSAASQMLGAANELSQQAETLRREVDQFLANVRAA
jgi:methyl-accepting chemotaxis protein